MRKSSSFGETIVRASLVALGWLSRVMWILCVIVFCCAASIAMIASLDYLLDFFWFGLQPFEEYLFAAEPLSLLWLLLIVPTGALVSATILFELNAFSQRNRSRYRNIKSSDFIEQLGRGCAPPFVLYLRPFLIERRSRRWRRIFRVLGAFENGFEMRLIRAAKPHKIVKLGVSESAEAELNSLTVSEQDWWQNFVSLAEAADKILIIPLAQSGTLRELTYICREQSLLDKTIFLMPPNASIQAGRFDLDPDVENVAKAWNLSRDVVCQRFGLVLPKHIHVGALLRRADLARFDAIPFLGGKVWSHAKVLAHALGGRSIYSLTACLDDYVVRLLFIALLLSLVPVLDAPQNGEVFKLPTLEAAWGASVTGGYAMLLRLHRHTPYRTVNAWACIGFCFVLGLSNFSYFYVFQQPAVNEENWLRWVWATWAPGLIVVLPMVFVWRLVCDEHALILTKSR